MDTIVLDTSVFTNPDVYVQFGPDSESALTEFIAFAHRLPVRFYMPCSVYEELRKVKEIEHLTGDFESVVRIRSPRKYGLMLPGELLYELIDEVRFRIDRGLRIAEDLTRQAGQTLAEADVGPLVTRLRERYREALRRGILDSREDVDVLLLAYELDGVLATADEGMRKWADKVGVKLVTPRNLRRIFENLARYHAAPPALPDE